MVKRIVIRTPNFIGDTIMMLPALELVRREYPDAEIDIVCKPHSREVFRGKNIAQIIEDDTKGKGRLVKTFSLIKKLRKRKYELGILYKNSFLSALIFRLGGTKILVGYNKEKRGFLLSFHIKYWDSWHYVNRYADLVNQYWGNKYCELPEMELCAEPSKLLKKREKPLIGFVLGGENKGARRYPKDLALMLFEQLVSKDFDIVLLGDEKDAQNHSAYAKFLEEKGKDVQDITGKTTVGEFIDAIAALDLLITIDTSALHIAAATDTEFLLLAGRGTSALDNVYPKSGKGHLLCKGQKKIRSEDIIREIKPKDIYEQIVEIVNKNSIFGGKEIF